MTRKLLLGCALVAGLFTGAAALTQAQDKKEHQPSPEEQAWMEAMNPGEHHKKLEPLVGDWEVASKFWMGGPGAPAEESKGTARHQWVLGGRFIHQTYKGSMMGMPFEGAGMTGYDVAQKKYVGSWVDTMGTGIMSSTGEADKDFKVFTFQNLYFDPAAKKQKTMRSVVTILGPDKHTYEMFDNGPDGKEFRTGELVYTRKK